MFAGFRTPWVKLFRDVWMLIVRCVGGCQDVCNLGCLNVYTQPTCSSMLLDCSCRSLSTLTLLRQTCLNGSGCRFASADFQMTCLELFWGSHVFSHLKTMVFECAGLFGCLSLRLSGRSNPTHKRQNHHPKHQSPNPGQTQPVQSQTTQHTQRTPNHEHTPLTLRSHTYTCIHTYTHTYLQPYTHNCTHT
jgi:hypothetical protein